MPRSFVQNVKSQIKLPFIQNLYEMNSILKNLVLRKVVLTSLTLVE